MLLIGAMLFDSLACNAQTIAFQSDSSGFVSLISYLGIIYGFVADLLIFNESFSAIELIAASTMFIVIVGISVYKVRENYLKKFS